MTIEICTSDPRAVKALAILETASTWQRGHTREGRAFYAVPSQSSDVLHLVDCRACSCQDFRRRGEACKHVLAVRLWVARQAPTRREAASGPATSPTSAMSPADLREMLENL